MPFAHHVGRVSHSLELLRKHGVAQIRAFKRPEIREIRPSGGEFEREPPREATAENEFVVAIASIRC